VSFEGSFISVQGVTAIGTRMTAELRNDGSANVPAIGAAVHMSFAAQVASILPSGAEAKHA
jgi:hypothetical protein